MILHPFPRDSAPGPRHTGHHRPGALQDPRVTPLGHVPTVRHHDAKGRLNPHRGYHPGETP